MTLLAIDPGPTESAYCIINDERKPIHFGKINNRELLKELWTLMLPGVDRVAIEMIDSYGMPVGAEVFETCVWIGRFAQEISEDGIEAELVKRREVKLHHCHSAKATDTNVRYALVDRFAPGKSKTYGKGTKAAPGFFYGFKADVWAAYALAVYALDTWEAI